MWAARILAGSGDMVMDRTPAAVLVSLRTLPRLEPDELLGDPHLAPVEVDLGPTQADQPAPAHAAVDGQVDQRPVALPRRLGQVDGLLPGEEDHLPLGHAGCRGWTLTSWPREYTRTKDRAARTSTRWPIRFPGTE
jgi:hypothetical protein